jgi:GT2 family glycosyltransferase
MVSIITINYNLSKETIPCIQSLLASDYRDYRIFLVDNGSQSEDYLKLINVFDNNPKVKLLRIEKNCGYVGGVNYGIRNARNSEPDYIMVMNNDTIIDRKAVGCLVDAAKRHNNRAIVSGKVYYYYQPDVLQHTGVLFKDHRYLTTIYPGRNEIDTGQFNDELERDSLDDVFWLFPVKLIDDIGLYSDYFFLYAEQGDFAQRAKRNGYKLIFTPEAKIWHKESMTIGAGNPQAPHTHYWRGKSAIIFTYRNLKNRFFIANLVIIMLKAIVNYIINRNGIRSIHLARLRGYKSGIEWLFHKKADTGYNPYL